MAHAVATTTPTLILSSRYTPDAQRLWQAAIQRGWRVERLPGWRVPDSVRHVQQPVFYLEALMAPLIADAFGITLLDLADEWLPQLPHEYRRRRVQLMTVAEARHHALPAFVKPPNDKSFPARVYDRATFPTDLPETTPVLVADVVEWETEFRCFILDRTVQTVSLYARHHELQAHTDFACSDAEGQAVQDFLTTLLADLRVVLPRAVVLDVGVIAHRGWAVVEANAAWGAGLYGCDAGKVLDVLRATVIPSTGGDRGEECR